MSEKPRDYSSDEEELDLALDYEEEVTNHTQPRRGVHLLPNILTAGTLVAGFYTIIFAIQSEFVYAAWSIFVAMIFDAMDGRVARWTHTQSQFGAAYDNLSDMVAFGIAPAVLMLLWGMGQLAQWAYPATIFYVLCCSIRLARFSTNSDDESPGHYFQGLPSPAAAAFIASIVWAMQSQGFNGTNFSVGVLCAVFLVITAVCMVSKFPYLSFKGFDVKDRVPLVGFLLVAFAISLMLFLPAIALMFLGIIFVLSGPLMWILGIGKTPKKQPQPEALVHNLNQDEPDSS